MLCCVAGVQRQFTQHRPPLTACCDAGEEIPIMPLDNLIQTIVGSPREAQVHLCRSFVGKRSCSALCHSAAHASMLCRCNNRSHECKSKY